MAFESMVMGVINREGGYVNDPDDPGGETKYGISKKSYPDLDIKGLSIMDAVEIYHHDYWKPSKVEKLPKSLREAFFDMVVNMGLRRAVKIIQKACNSVCRQKIKVDGLIGPKTLNASKKLKPDRLRSYRIMYYASLVAKRPTLEKFWYGWYRRSNEV